MKRYFALYTVLNQKEGQVGFESRREGDIYKMPSAYKVIYSKAGVHVDTDPTTVSVPAENSY